MEQLLKSFNVEPETVACGLMPVVSAIREGTPGSAEGLTELAHDARNMVTALSLYCDLLEEPGVLAHRFTHYGSDLRMVSAASYRLVEKLVALNENGSAPGGDQGPEARPEAGSAGLPSAEAAWEPLPALPISNLAEEILSNRNLLAALVGPAIALVIDAEGGAEPVWMTAEDLTRVLVNLTKNAVEAMSGGGRLQISLTEQPAISAGAGRLLIAVEDSGPGIAGAALEKVFERGYTTRNEKRMGIDGQPAIRRGLGLAICRSIAEAAGGTLTAMNRSAGGARLEMTLPVAASIARTSIHPLAGFVVS